MLCLTILTYVNELYFKQKLLYTGVYHQKIVQHIFVCVQTYSLTCTHIHSQVQTHTQVQMNAYIANPPQYGLCPTQIHYVCENRCKQLFVCANNFILCDLPNVL